MGIDLQKRDAGGATAKDTAGHPALGKRTLTEALLPGGAAQGAPQSGRPPSVGGLGGLAASPAPQPGTGAAGAAARGTGGLPAGATARGTGEPPAGGRQEPHSLLQLFGPQAAQDGGNGLPAPVLAKMQRAFGADFGGVRFHPSSPEAAALGAQAFARGGEVHVAPGHWDPESQQGQELIGHELAHVVQQAQGRVSATEQYRGVAVSSDKGLEAEADHWGAIAAGGGIATSSGVTAGGAGGAAQLKIGFEMQSTWQIRRIGKNVDPDSKDVAYRGMYFKIEVDKSPHPELEIVTDPLASREDFENAMREIRYVVEQMVALGKRQTFVVPAGNGWLEDTEIFRTGEVPTFRLQYTEGVTLEQIPSLIKQLHPAAWKTLPEEVTGEDPDKAKKVGAKRKGKAKDEPEPTALRGLIAAVCTYLGDAQNWAPEQKGDTNKYAHTLMARTDFYAMYHSLEDEEADEFAAKFAKGQDDFYGFALDAQVYQAPAMATKLTVRQWLQSMVAGRARGGKKADEPKDLMSPPPGFETHANIEDHNAKAKPGNHWMHYAMGMYGLDDDGLALFEARKLGSALGQDLDGSEEFLRGVLDNGAGERDDAFAAKGGKDGDKGEKRPRRAAAQKQLAKGKPKADPLGDKGKPVGKGKAPPKLGENYMPTPTQVARMVVHGRQLHWIVPDGLCMLGSLSHVTGRTVVDIRDTILAQLDLAGSAARNWLRDFAPMHGWANVRRVVGDLVRYWNDPAADAVLGVACIVLATSVTVLKPDGTPIPINGGGHIILQVTNPLGHYHSTDPAVAR